MCDNQQDVEHQNNVCQPRLLVVYQRCVCVTLNAVKDPDFQ